MDEWPRSQKGGPGLWDHPSYRGLQRASPTPSYYPCSETQPRQRRQSPHALSVHWGPGRVPGSFTSVITASVHPGRPGTSTVRVLKSQQRPAQRQLFRDAFWIPGRRSHSVLRMTWWGRKWYAIEETAQKGRN